MRGSNFVLVVAPIAILIMLIPAFEASTFPNIVKGSVIGLYLSLSLIGIVQFIDNLRF